MQRNSDNEETSSTSPTHTTNVNETTTPQPSPLLDQSHVISSLSQIDLLTSPCLYKNAEFIDDAKTLYQNDSTISYLACISICNKTEGCWSFSFITSFALPEDRVDKNGCYIYVDAGDKHVVKINNRSIGIISALITCFKQVAATNGQDNIIASSNQQGICFELC